MPEEVGRDSPSEAVGMNIVSRREALLAGYSTYFTGKPCKHGHIAPRFTSSRQCKECSKIKAASYYTRDGRGKARNRRLLRDYSLSSEQFDRLLERQDGRCAICNAIMELGRGTSPTQCCVDHDHTTGEVRGLLCNHCNRALGLFKDSEENLRRAFEYLRNERN